MTVWFVAQVKPNADQIAKRNLERQGFRTFQPMEKRTLVKAGRFVDQTRPFFTGYLFVSYPEEAAPWSLVNSTYGVSRLVRFGNRPAPVPYNVVADLQAACSIEGVITLQPEFIPGSIVEVKDGAFTSFVGQVERLSPDHRAMVLLDFIGRQTKVNLPMNQLRNASCSTKLAGVNQ